MRKLIATLALLGSFCSYAIADGNLEIPANGSTVSGVGLFSGWHCDAEVIEIMINGQSIEAAYGTSREDTQSICGDSDNGFGLLFNMALLGPGQHEAVAFADGQQFARRTFSVTSLSTGEFLTGVSGGGTVKNFPSQGREIDLAWNQAAQNFFITAERESLDPYGVAGAWATSDESVVVSVNTRQNANGSISIAALTALPSGWQAFIGSLSKTTAVLESFEGYSPEVRLRATFTSPTQMRVDVESCSPSFNCALQTGDTVFLQKAF